MIDFNKINFRKVLQVFSYYIAPIVMFLGLYSGIVNKDLAYDFSVWLGNQAIGLLGIILFLKPVNVIFSIDFFKNVVPNKLDSWNKNLTKIYNFIVSGILKRFLSLRRELGILDFWLAVWHSIYLLFYLEVFNFSGLLDATDVTGALFWGILAILGMVILGITSNKISAIRLKSNWKKVQMLAYPVFIFSMIHTAINNGENQYYVVLVIYGILKGVQYYIIRKRKK